MDIISEIQSNAHETSVMRGMLLEYFTANPHLVEFMPFRQNTINQRYHLWTSLPSEMLILVIRLAIASHENRIQLAQFGQMKKYNLHYELTLTVPPTQPNPKEHLLASVGKIINSRMMSIAQAYFVFEKTEIGTPHVHMLLRPEPNTTIQASRIKKLFKHRFTLTKVRDLHAYCEYLIKDIDSVEHIEFNDIQNPPPTGYATTQELQI